MPTPQNAIATPLLIVWHSRTGASEQLSAAALAGALALEPDSPARRMPCDEVEPGDMLAARSYLFVCPENLGSMSGLMKEFFDRCYYPLLDQINGRAFGVVVSAGSDGQGAARQIERIATGWRLKRISDTVVVPMHAQTPEQILAPKHVDAAALKSLYELGGAMAGGVVMGIY